jgi:hypothetical protein
MSFGGSDGVRRKLLQKTATLKMTKLGMPASVLVPDILTFQNAHAVFHGQ